MCYLQYKPFDINEDIIVQQQYFISFLVMINVVIYECGLNIWNAQLKFYILIIWYILLNTFALLNTGI